ncbi:MAG: cytoplasmic protein [Deltaproteobacteria bacterium]|nr:cytoplasmic protein [Deltaproteobacteria bacterium]
MGGQPFPVQNRAPQEAFEQFEASALYCPRCRQAVPVRKRLLLVIPEGDKYEYLCVHCGASVGDKIEKNLAPAGIIPL